MITNEERIIIKKVLGVHYTNSVYEFLKEEKIFSGKNKPYSKRMIQAVCQGTRENAQIEYAIIKLCLKKSQKQISLDYQKNKLFENHQLPQNL